MIFSRHRPTCWQGSFCTAQWDDSVVSVEVMGTQAGVSVGHHSEAFSRLGCYSQCRQYPLECSGWRLCYIGCVTVQTKFF